MNMPGAVWTQARVFTLAAALGSWKTMMTESETESTSRTPDRRLATSR